MTHTTVLDDDQINVLFGEDSIIPVNTNHQPTVVAATPPVSTNEPTNPAPVTDQNQQQSVPLDTNALLTELFEDDDDKNQNPTNNLNPTATTPPASANPTTPSADPAKLNEPAKPNASTAIDPVVQEGLGKMQDFLIKAGVWSDYQDRDKVVLTNETFADLALKQANYNATKAFEEIVNELPTDAQRLLTYVSNGGDANKVAQLFTLKAEVSNLNPTTPVEKESYIKNYYKSLNWNDSMINTHFDRIKASGDAGIESEFQLVKPLYTSMYEEKIAAQETALENQKAKKAADQAAYRDSMISNIQAKSDLTKKDKELVYKKLFDNSVEVNGQRVNGFFSDFMKVQQNPNEYIDLILFLNDKEAYLKRELSKRSSVQNEQGFNFLSANAGGAQQAQPNPTTNTAATKGKEATSVFKWTP